MPLTRTREELESELEDLTQRLERIVARKSNDRADDFQNLEEAAQSHGEDDMIDSLEERTRARIAEIQTTLGAHTMLP
jgi:hypothetical protein